QTRSLPPTLTGSPALGQSWASRRICSCSNAARPFRPSKTMGASTSHCLIAPGSCARRGRSRSAACAAACSLFSQAATSRFHVSLDTFLPAACSSSSQTATCREEAASHILAVRSELPVTIRWPSAETATDPTQSLCPLRVSSSLPLAASQTLADRSSLPVTIRWLSADNTTYEIAALCPLSVSSSSPLVAS